MELPRLLVRTSIGLTLIFPSNLDGRAMHAPTKSNSISLNF